MCTINQTTTKTHLLDLTSLTGSLDVLEVHLLILAEVDDGTEEVEQPLVRFERLKQVY